MDIRYPVYQPYLSGREAELVQDCLSSTWISSKGKYVEEFEKKFADYVGANHAVSVCNGTVALHVALVALGIGPGDEVLVPSLTYVATANAVAYTGATPVFVDSEAQFWQLDIADARSKVTSKTKAIIPVHLYGHPCDMSEISEIATEFSLYVIEDCAEALGSKYANRHVGTNGVLSIFSFFGNKTITTGEGGMVVTDDAELADRVRKFKGQGLADDREYWHDVIGFNYRMTNICAAIGVAQLESVEEILARKRDLASWYEDALRDLPLETHHESPGSVHSYWMFSILTQSESVRDQLRADLRAQGVETRPLFNPLHLMNLYGTENQCLPVAEDLSRRGINLPSYPQLSRDDVLDIVSCISSSLCP